MLVELVVENYAVIERVRVRFARGLNLLTGETGSGKSIVVDALGLLYGGRASAEAVRSGAERARIAGVFEVPETAALRRLLDHHALETEDGELLIEREVQSTGKSRAFVGSRPVTVAVLRELAPHLGDIHGQHDQQELFSPDSQLEMLDAFAATGGARQQVADLYAAWRESARELDALDRAGQETLRLADLWRFQEREIAEAQLKLGEDAALEAERRVLMNVARLEESARSAYEALYGGEQSALALTRQARRRIEESCRIDGALGGTLEALSPAEIALGEAAHSLSHYLGGLEADPGRLDEVESRLALLDKLKRKYGATADEILRFLETVRADLEALDTKAARRAQLEGELARQQAAYGKAASALSAARQAAARRLEKAVRAELADLAMAGTEFRIEFTPDDWSAHGTDRVRFLVSANVGEEARPLDKIASGGELSRLALALKTCTAVKAHPAEAAPAARTLVFDEVDAGIGGRAAEAVARRLKRLAAAHQVLCVTHLPQVAAFADRHFVVAKHEAAGRTVASIDALNGSGRTRELARMLSGEQVTPEALKHAEQLIKLSAATGE